MADQGLDASALPSPLDRYSLGGPLGAGVFARVCSATDQLAGAGKRVAIKIYDYSEEAAAAAHRRHADREYRALRDAQHPNVIQFYGAFCERGAAPGALNVWFVLELCECSLAELVRRRLASGGRMSEEHIAFVLKGVIKALTYLHERGVLHCNVRGGNILLGADGEVKLGGFSLACRAGGGVGADGGCADGGCADGGGALARCHAGVGSPAYMAPEVVAAESAESGGEGGGYDSRADVWSLGITAIELADGRAPYEDMHPTRALFQIARNPPPGLDRSSAWSNHINDFIQECLEKNPEHRPFVVELAEHPFIQAIPEKDYHLTQELKKLALDMAEVEVAKARVESVVEGGMVRAAGAEPEPLLAEDLAALDELSEATMLRELQLKWARGAFTSYVGDCLLVLNPLAVAGANDADSDAVHRKYECRSRSDNEPHIFGVADGAYQDALHHREPQHIVLCGESGSGKSTMARLALRHLTYLGAMPNSTAERVRRAASALRVATAAATPLNAHSTRCVLQTQVTYGATGKLSGAIFWLYQLEKWRVASTDMAQANFNLLYYFYDAMEAEGKLEKYSLEKGRKHRYLRVSEEGAKGPRGARDTPAENAEHYRNFCADLAALDCEPEELATLESVLAAILVLGNVRFRESKEGAAEIENPDEASKVAGQLQLDSGKFSWALLKYCVVQRGAALQRRHSADEARDARDTLAAALYKRLLDSLVNRLNLKLSFGRAVFGDKYSVSILDMFGFECFHRNRLEQLIVNTTNEQLQFLYNQRTFAWEGMESAEEGVAGVALRFYDNKTAVDQLMGRPLGLFYMLDEASRSGGGLEFIMSSIKNSRKGPYIKLSGSHEFSVAHYAGKINYDAREMADKNRDFLPPEMIETLRASGSSAVQALFRNKLTRTGNLTSDARTPPPCAGASPGPPAPPAVAASKADKDAENIKTRKYNTKSRGQWSQLHRMRTAAATYRATSLELLRQLSVGPGSGGAHFVKCVRADLAPVPRAFQPDLVRHQLRALAVLDTATARQKGFSCRIPFHEFIRRYKFLAFDFDENVEETRDNCRLLLIRLKMEGWVLGKTKVFLKYYDEEFLARLYERQVKKIVKVQCMMRAFLARRKAIQSKSKMQHLKELKKQHSVNVSEDEAALLIQKAYRGYVVRKAYGPLVSKATGQIDEETAGFLKRFALKWKSRSIFQVLLQYRAVRYQDLVHFSQQVHIYNQATVSGLCAAAVSGAVPLERVEPHARERDFLPAAAPSVRKLPFRIHQLQYIDTDHLCRPARADPSDTFASQNDSDQETWDGPLKRRSSGNGLAPLALPDGAGAATTDAAGGGQAIIHVPFCRDPAQPIPKLPEDTPAAGRPHRGPARPPVYKKKQSAGGVGAGHYQPPTPWSARDDRQALEAGARSERSRSAYASPAPELQNPIRELQLLARSAGDLNSGDDAPFNFQAMLKKTPRNRASMKRSGESAWSAPAAPPTPGTQTPAPPTPRNQTPAPPTPRSQTPAPPTPRNQTPAPLTEENQTPVPPPTPKRAVPSAPTPKRAVPPAPKSPAPTAPRARFAPPPPVRSPDIFEVGDMEYSDERIGKVNKIEYERVQLAPDVCVEGEVIDL